MFGITRTGLIGIRAEIEINPKFLPHHRPGYIFEYGLHVSQLEPYPEEDPEK